MVDLLLNTILIIRIGDLSGYLEAIYEFLTYCFSLNRHNYSRNLLFFYIDMINLKTRNPIAYMYLEDGGFSGSLSGSIHSNISMDQMIETTLNRFSKSAGGLSEKAENLGSSNRWTRLNYYLCALKEYMNNKIRRNKRNNHIGLGAQRMDKDENDVLSIFEGLKQWVPNIYFPNQQLFNIYTGIMQNP